MSWFSRKPKPVDLRHEAVQAVVDLLGQMDRWEIGGPRMNAYADFTLHGPNGIRVERGSYESFWYEIRVGEDKVTGLTTREYAELERAAQDTYSHLRQPGIERDRQDRLAAEARIAAALEVALAA